MFDSVATPRADPIMHLQDEELIRSWLNDKSSETKRAYIRMADELLATLHPGALKDATLPLLQNFIEIKKTRKLETQGQRVAIVRSLFSFAVETGYLTGNPALKLKLKLPKKTLSERYLSEEEVMRMIALTTDLRDRTLIKVLYSSGCRISELCAIKWKDIKEREEGRGQIRILGKGSREREVLVSASTLKGLLEMKAGNAREEDHVFRSQKKGSPFLTPQMVRIVVRRAAYGAGIKKKVSPHWLRHCHASHALDRGAPIHLVQTTLGHASVATTGKYLHARPSESSGKFLGV